MPATEDLLSPGAGGLDARRAGRRAKRWCRALIALAVLVIVFCAVTARLFVWPDRGTPGTVSAIVMLDGPGDTLGVASRLAAQHRAPFLVLSLGTPASGYSCPRPEPRVTVICFNPRPATTQGEAEFVGRLARKYQWRSVAVVAITPPGLTRPAAGRTLFRRARLRGDGSRGAAFLAVRDRL